MVEHNITACDVAIIADQDDLTWVETYLISRLEKAHLRVCTAFDDSTTTPAPDSLPPDIYTQLRQTLLNCGPFDSDQELKDIFVDERISQWRDDLPEAKSDGERIEAVIAYLLPRYNAQQENALGLLLTALSSRLQPEDACYSRLNELRGTLDQALQHARMTQAIARCHHLLLVLTPADLVQEGPALTAWVEAVPASQRDKIWLVLREPCDLPPPFNTLQSVDLSAQPAHEETAKRFVHTLKTKIPLPEREPWRTLRVWPRQHPRTARLGIILGLGLMLLLLMGLQWPPFHPREAWNALALKARNVKTVARIGDIILVGGYNLEYGCDHTEMGLWRSDDEGVSWQIVTAPLCYQDPDQGKVLADINGFAGDADRAYAVTNRFLFYSVDQGANWHEVEGAFPLAEPELQAVATHPGNSNRVYVTHASGGLFRSDDGGGKWTRLDRRDDENACENGFALTGSLRVGALAVTEDYVIAGTGAPETLSDLHVPPGLYISADGGTCWESLPQGSDKSAYLALAYASAENALFVILNDRLQNPKDKWNEIWRLDLGTPTEAQRTLLKETRSILKAIAVQDDTWYAATAFGQVYKGPVAYPSTADRLSRFLLPCVLSCDEVQFAADTQSEYPLLLIGRRHADGKLLRRQTGAWWHRIWP